MLLFVLVLWFGFRADLHIPVYIMLRSCIVLTVLLNPSDQPRRVTAPFPPLILQQTVFYCLALSFVVLVILHIM